MLYTHLAHYSAHIICVLCIIRVVNFQYWTADVYCVCTVSNYTASIMQFQIAQGIYMVQYYTRTHERKWEVYNYSNAN